MSRNVNSVVALVAAVMALGPTAAPAAIAAEAPRWKVAGAFLGNGTGKVFTAISTGKVKLAAPGFGTLVSNTGECGAIGTIVGTVAGVEGRLKEVTYLCEQAAVEGAPTCIVQPFETVKLGGNLGWMEETGTAASVLLDPEAGATLTTIIIEECALEGEYPVTGESAGGFFPEASEVFAAEVVYGPTTTTSHWFTPKDPSARPTMAVTALKLGAKAATLSGQFEVILASSQNFGVFSG